MCALIEDFSLTQVRLGRFRDHLVISQHTISP